MSGFESDESTELAPSVSYQTPTSIPVNKEADRECVGRNRPRSESANAAVSRSVRALIKFVFILFMTRGFRKTRISIWI